ncbi:hypothetical protein Hanom_Chr06g00507411 [Helianthus anomalus]
MKSIYLLISVVYTWKHLMSGASSLLFLPVAKLEISDRRVENVYNKNFYKTEGSKTYTPKNFYTKTTYSPLLNEKFGGSAAPSRPHKATPLILTSLIGRVISFGVYLEYHTSTWE